MKPYVVSRFLPRFRACNGIWINPDHGLHDCPRPDIVCISDFFIDPTAGCAGKFNEEVAWLRAHHEAGAILATACSGAVLLAEAGLLHHCDATIHWGFARALTDHYPTVRVHTDRALVVSGIGQRIVMAGGGMSWHDLALYLIGRHVGLKEAMEVAKLHMLHWHDLGQQPFAHLAATRQADDALVAKCQAWVADNYAAAAPVAAMIALSGLPERSFSRRFKRATGLTPMDYIHALRLEEAKQMLETSDVTIEGIAVDVGYEDASFFNRLFRRKVGLTPAQYRRRFASLRKAVPDRAA